jgi:hypothetical protein
MQPDLAFSMGYVSCFMERPTMEHMGAMKRMLRYITAQLVSYSDIDLFGDIDTCKSTFGALFVLGASLVSWLSMKQRIIALSSCEEEYVAATTAARQAI